MTRRALALVATLALSPGGAASTPREAWITSPDAARLAAGPVLFAIAVHPAEELHRAVFLIDGAEVGRRESPPWQVRFDVGQANREHLFEARLVWKDGSERVVRRETPRLHVNETLDLDLQQLYVTVTRDGRRVLDLHPEDFLVLDDRQPQRLVTFEGGDVPLAAAILVDASSSMRGAKLEAAVEGARAFIRALEELDEASLMLFSDCLVHTTPFTARGAELAEGLGRAVGEGGTAVNDALYFAVRSLEARQGRRVVILLSDGVDVESVLTMRDVAWAIRRSRSIVYWIRLMPREDGTILRYSSWRSPEGHAAEIRLLEDAVHDSGGRIVPIAAIEKASSAFGEILSELREQYVLGFYPTHDVDDLTWHRIEVRVEERGSKVRTRDGYFDQ